MNKRENVSFTNNIIYYLLNHHVILNLKLFWKIRLNVIYMRFMRKKG